MKFKALVLGLACLGLAACASGGARREHPALGPTQPTAVEFALQPTSFQNLPGWASTDLAPALLAFKRTCDGRRLRDPGAPMAGNGRYGGTVADWAPACAAAASVAPGGERAFFEANFTPYEVRGSGEARLTAYFEPMIEARRTPQPGFTEPLLRKPNDMVSVDVAAFAEAYDDATLRGAPRRLTGQLVGQSVVPYPKREALQPLPGQVVAYANPVDVYNLQVQGSGRLSFPDGSQTRAAYAAQNGYRWSSALAAMRAQLPGGANWANFRTWAAQNGDQATHAALNADPSYVFFNEEQIDDPTAGPRGAAGVPLTPMGSIAVDPAFHPYGALVYVDGMYEGVYPPAAPFQRLLVAQDTGGAIRRGPQRGDIFFGTGPAAGQAAEHMNSQGVHWWTLLPRNVPVA